MIIAEQRSQEWFDIRKGKITSSEIHKILGRDALTETAKTYLLEKVSELYGGVAEPATGAALEWGTELEPLAIETYESMYDVKVGKASFIEHNRHYGGSPDGLVDPDGVIEAKCPHRSVNHFKHAMIVSPESFKKVAPNYYYQCISNMICAKANWCDFISFDPRVDENYRLYVYRLPLIEEEVQFIEERLKVAVEYMNELALKLKTNFQQ